MKSILLNYGTIGLLLFFLCITSCNVDTWEEVEKLPQVISLVQIGEGTVNLKAENLIINKEKRMYSKGFGLALSGFGNNAGFNATLELDYEDIPEGTYPFTPSQCFISASQNDTEKINSLHVPAGQQQQVFYIHISNEAIEANEGKVLAVKLKVKNPDRYSLNPNDSVYIRMDTQDFASRKTEITYRYFLNNTFARDPAEPNERFDNLEDWIANEAITSSRPGGAGYDDNQGCMGIERWGEYDSPIDNGKIYQTFTLPAGRYSVEVLFRQITLDPDNYVVVSSGKTLPDAVNIAQAIAYTEIRDGLSYQTVPLEFSLEEATEVSIGFLINIVTTQKVVMAESIRLFLLESFFD